MRARPHTTRTRTNTQGRFEAARGDASMLRAVKSVPTAARKLGVIGPSLPWADLLIAHANNRHPLSLARALTVVFLWVSFRSCAQEPFPGRPNKLAHSQWSRAASEHHGARRVSIALRGTRLPLPPPSVQRRPARHSCPLYESQIALFSRRVCPHTCARRLLGVDK